MTPTSVTMVKLNKINFSVYLCVSNINRTFCEVLCARKHSATTSQNFIIFFYGVLRIAKMRCCPKPKLYYHRPYVFINHIFYNSICAPVHLSAMSQDYATDIYDRYGNRAKGLIKVAFTIRCPTVRYQNSLWQRNHNPARSLTFVLVQKCLTRIISSRSNIKQKVTTRPRCPKGPKKS